MKCKNQKRKHSRYKVPVVRIPAVTSAELRRQADDRKFGNRSIKLVLMHLRGEITRQEFELQMQALENEMLPLFQSATAC